MITWNKFWFSREDVLPLAVTRIAVALLLLAMFTVAAPNWDRFYAADGVMSLVDEDLNASRVQDWYCIMNWTEGIVPILTWWWVGVALSICLLIGWHTRIASIGLFVLLNSLINRAPVLVNGEDLVIRMLLFYGCFSPWASRCSVDAIMKAHSSGSPALAAKYPVVWAWRLMQLNFVLIYAISLPYKFADDVSWINGDAFHWTVASDMWWTRNWMSQLTLSYDGWIRRILTWSTVLLEGAFPILVWSRVTRVPIVLSLMALHISIAFCIPGVTLFTLSMVVGALSFLPSAFYANLHRMLRIAYESRFQPGVPQRTPLGTVKEEVHPALP